MGIVKIPLTDYKDFYVEKGNSGAVALYADMGIVAKSNPVPVVPNAKEPYKNQWKDQDGDDEYDGPLFYEAFEVEYSYFLKAQTDNNGTAVSYINAAITELFDWMSTGQFKFYDTYTGLGYQKVRYVGYETESFMERQGSAQIIFKIKAKVNDPYTKMTLSNGHIIVAE